MFGYFLKCSVHICSDIPIRGRYAGSWRDGRNERPELHIQVTCVQSFACVADSLEKADMLPVYCYSDNLGYREGSAALTSVVFV